jgi:hypothetical protein
MTAQLDPKPVAGASPPARPGPVNSSEPEIKIYSHSPILYWWPVWLVGFLMAFLTAVDGGRMAYVPPGTRAEGNTLVASAEHVALEDSHDRMARSPYLGTWFFLTLLVVFVCSNVPLRGLWEWVVVLGIALVLSLITLYGLWGRFAEWFRLVHIHINLAGYLFLSVWMFAIWVVSVFLFDRRTYLIFSAGQVRILDEIGEAEKVYDVTNMSFQVLPNIFLRHRILGLYGAGDLIIRTGGPQPETFEWPNVLLARSRLKQIQARLKAREVV